ncbi:hypothetical protein CPB83DRAFT_822095 [Crepidotus variabilis]|uniref:Poly [ADP-ribose] polymerase n=1 Tax=Crepidotus variabilis TaxID=179855 RepID=A0A9P6JJN8_9AGAR|nr:hypothetical protein CPB83DRAFT_822095 [Crepidotus variabilis]
MLHAALDASGHVHIHNCCTSPVNLIHVEASEPEYKLIAQQFKDGWKHPSKTLPTIKRIFYVAYSGAGLVHLAKFSDYSNKVGNTLMLFHGTRRGCHIAESPTAVASCNSNTCNLCKILKGSYHMERAKGARMFGPGIYSTLISSKADDYTSNTDDTIMKNVKSRVMIVNHVALGRTKIMYEASHDTQHAPHLYNSVTAATYPEGGKVNYHEAVVYREDAMCANAIIVYE